MAGNSDGSVKISTKLDESGIQSGIKRVNSKIESAFEELSKKSGKTVEELKADAKRIAQEYQKQGYNIPTSYKKAYRDIGLYSQDAYKETSEDAEKTGEAHEKAAIQSKKAWGNAVSEIESRSKRGLESIKNLASIAGKVIITSITAVSGALTAGAAAGVKYNAAIEQYQTSFEVMTGSAEKAAEVVEKLKKLGAETPFELPDLAEATQLLMNYGFTADEAIDRMEMLGDISQGSAEKMNRIATAYGQMSSAGKVQLEDIKQMIEAGFNPLQEISESTGESMESLYDRISKGTISVDEITDSMRRATSEGGKYYQSMEKQSKTLEGQLSTLKDNANSLLGEVVEPVSKSMTGKLLPSAIKTIEKLTEAYRKDGLKGLVKASGDAFADIVAGAAKQAPKMVNVAVDFIKSFVNGAKKNKGQILGAAKEIVKALADGLIDLLPNSMQKPVREAITAITQSFSSGGLSKAGKTVVTLFSNIIDVAGDLAGNILPAAIRVIDSLADHLDILGPLIVAVYTAFKGMSIVNSTTQGFGKLTEAAKSLFGVFSANPFGAFIAVVGGVTAGIATLAATMDGATEGEKRLKEAQDALGESYGRVGEAASAFNEGIKNAGSIFDNLNESILVSNEVQQDLATRMSEVQTEITEIARTASEERRQLTSDEITRLDELFQRMQELTAQELAIYQSRQAAVQDAATAIVNSKVSEASAFEEQAQVIINSAQQERDQVVEAAYNQMIEKNAINEQLLGTSAEYTNEWLAQQQAAAQQEYQTALNSANQRCADTLSVIQSGYQNQFLAQNDALNKFKEANQAEQDENARHNAEMQAMQEKADQLLNDERQEAVYERKEILDDMDRKEEEHQKRVSEIWQGVADAMTDSDESQIGAWLSMLAHTELYGGEISDEAQDQVDAFLAAYEKMPAETREAMKNAMSPMLDEMENAEPSLFSKASNIANGVLSRLRTAFDIHSPSKKTRKIFRQLMEGGELGLDEEKKSLFKKTSDISKGVLDRLKGLNTGEIMGRIRAVLDSQQASAASRFVYSVTGDEGSTDNPAQAFDYDRMARATAKAMEGMTVEVDERQFGRVIRKAAAL